MQIVTTLLEPQELAEIGPPEAVRLPIELVDPNPLNPRTNLPDVEGLAENIKRVGLIETVAVWRVGERYELLSGHRRLAAFKLLREREPFDPQWRAIPARIKTPSEATAELVLVSAQVHHVRWRPSEESGILGRWRRAGMTEADIAVSLSKSQPYISKRLGLYGDPVLSDFVLSEQLPTSVAEELLMVRSAERRRELAEQAVAKGWSWAEARKQANVHLPLRQAREIRRLANELRQAIAVLGPDDLSRPAQDALMALRQEIVRVAQRPKRGEKRQTIIPSIEQAQRAAGVNPEAKSRYSMAARVKRRTMPAPA